MFSFCHVTRQMDTAFHFQPCFEKNCSGSCCSIYMHLTIDIRDTTVRKLCAPLESLLTALRDYKTEKLGPTKPCSWPFAKWGDSNPAL